MADNFDVESLAKYLHLSTVQVTKMADRGKIPGRKVGGSWVFSHAEIHHWLEERMGVWDEEELARLEGALKQANTVEGEVTLAELMPVPAIAVPLAARTKSSIISSMVELVADTGNAVGPRQNDRCGPAARGAVFHRVGIRRGAAAPAQAAAQYSCRSR